jgi:hypothetical protein
MADGDFTLTVSLNGTTVSGRSENISVTKTFASVGQAINQELEIGTSALTIFKTGSNAGAGQLVAPVKCIVIKNISTANTCTIGVIKTGSKAFYVPLSPGTCTVLCDSSFDANGTGGVLGTTVHLDEITAQYNAGTNNKLEILVIK